MVSRFSHNVIILKKHILSMVSICFHSFLLLQINQIQMKFCILHAMESHVIPISSPSRNAKIDAFQRTIPKGRGAVQESLPFAPQAAVGWVWMDLNGSGTYTETPNQIESGWWFQPTPLKNMKVSWDDDIPNRWENNPVMFQSPPTSHLWSLWSCAGCRATKASWRYEAKGLANQGLADWWFQHPWKIWFDWDDYSQDI